MSWLGRLFGGGNKDRLPMEAGAHVSGQKPMSGMKEGAEMHMHHMAPAPGAKMAKDPVCGMDVNVDRAAATSVYQGSTYYFCAPGCKQAFDENPSKYLGGGGSKSMHDAEGGMHGCCH